MTINEGEMTMLKYEKHVVRRYEDFYCLWCGAPVYVGDTSIEVDEDHYYCSVACAKKDSFADYYSELQYNNRL